MKLSATFAERAKVRIARAEAASDYKVRRLETRQAVQFALASGVASFQEAVEAGHLPRALPLDGAVRVILALQEAGFKVTRNRRS